MTAIWVIALIAFVIYVIFYDKKIKNTQEYREAIYKKQKPPKKLLTKRWWSWAIIIFLACAVLVSSVGGDNDTEDSNSNASPKSHKVSKTKRKSNSSKPQKSKPNKEKNTGKAVTLGAGKYKVGRDIKPGRYVIKAVQGSGNLSNSNATINVILGTTADDDQVTSFTTNLVKGDKIDIDGIESTSFTPTPNKYTYKTQLSAGFWLVGRDIKPGRYVIKAVKGSGNLISSGGDDDLNEILGTTADDNQVTKVTADLVDGEVLQTNLELISLTKK